MMASRRPSERALRVLLVANDGMSAGHVARAIAIGRALRRRSEARGIALRIVFATTSLADALLANERFAFVRLPPPAAARDAGFGDDERRRLVRGVLEGVVTSFRPDLVVTDTFPAGPHGELAELDLGRAKRVLVRRAVPEDRAQHETLTTGMGEIDFAIVADDAVATDAALPVEVVRVPPITMGHEVERRDVARAKLGVQTETVWLVTAGGGGDPAAVAFSARLAESIARLAPDVTVVRAAGPLEPTRAATASAVHVLHEAPLAPWLAAFDGAFSAAGYNTAHELAVAGIPAALFACPRSFDDQAARARRFADRGFAHHLDRSDDAGLRDALDWLRTARPPRLVANGADRAADILLDRMGAP